MDQGLIWEQMLILSIATEFIKSWIYLASLIPIFTDANNFLWNYASYGNQYYSWFDLSEGSVSHFNWNSGPVFLLGSKWQHTALLGMKLQIKLVYSIKKFLAICTHFGLCLNQFLNPVFVLDHKTKSSKGIYHFQNYKSNWRIRNSLVLVSFIHNNSTLFGIYDAVWWLWFNYFFSDEGIFLHYLSSNLLWWRKKCVFGREFTEVEAYMTSLRRKNYSWVFLKSIEIIKHSRMN